MAVTYYEVELDTSVTLTEVDDRRNDELEEADKGRIVIGLPGGDLHLIYGSRYVTNGIGFAIEDGLVEIRLNETRTVLRTYGTWLWVEGDSHHMTSRVYSA